MKTFKDLEFKPHAIAGMGFDTQAKLDFDNGYGISVITGHAAYGDGDAHYEVAVSKGDHLCYDTPITEDVIGHQTAADVDVIMKQIQELKP